MKFMLLTDTLPPVIGGMQTICHELICKFQEMKADFVVVTTKRNEAYSQGLCFHPVLEVPTDARTRAVNTIHLRNIIDHQNIDVILTMDAGYISLAPVLPIPMVAVLNGSDHLFPFNAFPSPHSENLHARRAAIEMGLLRGVSVIANSELTKEMFCAVYQYPEEKVPVIYYGISDKLIQINPRREKLFSVYNVLTSMRLDKNAERKNVYGLIHAIHLLNLTKTSVRLTIMGDGDQREFITKYIDSLCLSDVISIKSAAYLSNEWFCMYEDADVFAMVPTAYEGFGLVYLEAQAFGLPVIARNPEVIGKNGGVYCFKPDGHTISGAIEAAMRTPWKRDLIHARAAEYTMEKYATSLHAKMSEVLK